jgi:2-methylcitrate dehydratase PrpD
MSRAKYMGITERIASFAVGAKFRDIPRGVKEVAKEHMLDGLATMLGGAREEASRQIHRYVARLGGTAEATILATRRKAPCQYAALANGVQGHVLDYDDTQLATSKQSPFGQLTHPTTPVLAASLAVAERLSATGREFLAAYIVGVEVACRLADAIDPAHYLHGLHPTGTIGVFGAAAAASRLFGLDVLRARRALGIAASLSAGVRANRGTMTKSLNAGRAAENGVVAAALARDGFTAALDVFEAPMGYFSAAAPKPNPRRLKFGRPFFFGRPGVAVKPYPCAGVLHPSLDLILELAQHHRIEAEGIKKVAVTMGRVAAAPLVYDRPASGLEGKFSMPFSAAVAILERKAGLEQYTDKKVRHPKITALMRKVELSRDPRLDALGLEHPRAIVEIVLKDGRSYRGRTTWPKGHPRNPLSRRELEEKTRECAAPCLAPRSIECMIHRVWSIEDLASVAALTTTVIRNSPGKE